MEHLLLKAVTAITDEGTFEAVISTEGIDREKDIVSATGMVDALRKWNRPIPLAWNHSTKAEDIFGSLDPASVKEVNGEVVAGGRVDLESTVGKEAWRSFKNRSIGFSFGYLVLAGTKRTGGGRHITALDVFEVTATPTPMNNETRVLNTKAMAPPDRAAMAQRMCDMADMMVGEDPPSMTDTEMAAEMRSMADMMAGGKTAEPDAVKELQDVKARLAESEKALDDLKKKADVIGKEPEARPVDPLRKRSEELALEIASGGMSLRTPPRKATAPEPELIPLKELKQRSRDLMLQVLSGQPE